MSDSKHVVPAALRTLFLELLDGQGAVDGKWDTVISRCKICVVIDGKKVIDSEARKECASDFAEVSLERDGITEKHANYKDAMKAARTVFSNGITRRMRPDAKIRQKDGKSRPAPFAGWKVPAERTPKSTGTATTASVVVAIAVPVSSLRPLVSHALSAANDVTALLAAFQAEAKLSKVQAAACGVLATGALTVVNRITAIQGLLPEASDDPGKAVDDASKAMAGNGADVVVPQ